MTTTNEGTQRDELAQDIAASLGGGNASVRAITNVAEALITKGYRKPRTITTVEELDRELIVKSANSMDPFYLPSQGAPLRNVVTGARVTLEELDVCGDFFPVTVLWDQEAEATQ